MARIRKVSIRNFRGIQSFDWIPSSGINCLIGPGDSGKSTILGAIDLCLGARRTAQITDADFFELNVDAPISISLLLGDLGGELKNIEVYGDFLKGFDANTGVVEEEPRAGIETVLELRLTVGADLEPYWRLVSERAAAQDKERNLTWADRTTIAPTRIGHSTEFNLSWRRGSVLNRITDEKADASAALAKAARNARSAFGTDAESQLSETLAVVKTQSDDLGINVGEKVRALLDAHSVTFSGGTISLHNEGGVPLRGLGTGSTRLLVAGLQKAATGSSSILLVDELEHGLEPHRIIRFLGALGSKDQSPAQQVFLTTHSPVVLRELDGGQLFVVRCEAGQHNAMLAGQSDEIQGTIRAYPEAFLARRVLVCEGASEVGLIRGLDQFFVSQGGTSIFAAGLSLLDGGGVSKLIRRGRALNNLGYATALFRDDDAQPAAAEEDAYIANGSSVFKWRENCALEDELFLCMPPHVIALLLTKACEIHGREIIEAHIVNASGNAESLAAIEGGLGRGQITVPARRALGIAARTKATPWFKNVSTMEDIGRNIVGSNLGSAAPEYQQTINAIFSWARNISG